MRNIWISVLVVFMASCGGETETTKSTPVEKPQEELTQTPPAKQTQNKPREKTNYAELDSTIVPFLKKLDSVYQAAPYYFKDGEDYLFYVVQGDWPGKFSYDKPSKVYKMGIVTDDMQMLLPLEYEKLFTPDGTAKGFIEVKQQGKYGLVNYTNGQLIKAEYEVIFPPSASDHIAIGKQGKDYYALKADGNRSKLPVDKRPNYMQLLRDRAFDVNDQRLLYDSYAYRDEYDPEYYVQAIGSFVTPGYLLSTGFFSEYIENVHTGELFYNGITDNEVEVEESFVNSLGIGVLFSSFLERGVDAREFVTDQRRLATVNAANNEVVSATIVYEYNLHGLYGTCEEFVEHRFLNDTLLEVHYFDNLRDEVLNYDGMSRYDYYGIKPDGAINKLDLPRIFDFTHFVDINKSYFEDCFVEMSEQWLPIWEEEFNSRQTQHLTADDLDVMRNEIYAEYGYKFKTAKWDSFFRLQPWYDPRFDNVDDKLTEREKANIKLILEVKEKLLQDPEKYLKTEFTNVGAAG